MVDLMNLLSDVLIGSFQMLMLNDLGKNMFPYRIKTCWTRILIYGVTALVILGVNHIESTFINIMMVPVSYTIASIVIFQGSVWKKIILTCCYYMLAIVPEFLFAVITGAYGVTGTENNFHSELEKLLSLLLMSTITFLLVKCVNQITRKKNYQTIENKLFTVLLTLPAATIIIFMCIYYSQIVFCFHHAGGSASVYRKWTLKKEKINFVCVELPGKGTRRKERFIENFEELVGPLVESIINVADDRNILFFGHSMGAAMAFYAAAYMAQNYGREPRKIVVAGRQAPNEVNLTEFKSYMDDDALIKELIRYQATPKEILQNQELLSFVLPEVRRDYKLNESFIYRGECINSPLILHSGVNDIEANKEIMQRWSSVTKKVVRMREFQSDHFFVLNLGNEYWEQLYRDLLEE